MSFFIVRRIIFAIKILGILSKKCLKKILERIPRINKAVIKSICGFINENKIIKYLSFKDKSKISVVTEILFLL